MKKDRQRTSVVVLAAALTAAAMFTGCSFFNDNSEGETVTTTTTQATRRTVLTTKTAVPGLDPDADDEGLGGYTTTTTVTGHLDTDVSFDDGYDMKVRATMTKKEDKTETTTTTTVKETTKAKTTTTTAFKKDALYQLTEEDTYQSRKTFKVTSDTTYLNLRFGPSKKYDVQLKIPDGVDVEGFGVTTEKDTGEKWVNVEYNSTRGWVMKSLLTEK